jgi:hypothetical protein
VLLGRDADVLDDRLGDGWLDHDAPLLLAAVHLAALAHRPDEQRADNPDYRIDDDGDLSAEQVIDDKQACSAPMPLADPYANSLAACVLLHNHREADTGEIG